MATHQQVPTDPIDLSSGKAADHVERVLDQAIEDSFPNSDPVSLAMPHDHVDDDVSRKLQMPAGMRDTWPLLLVGGIIVALLLGRRR